MTANRFAWPIRVYFEDTDVGGVVYHASYLRFLERARTEWLRAHGIAQSRLKEERGLLFAITAIEMKFLKPARLDDELTASCALDVRRGASLSFAQEIIRPCDGALLITAKVRAACLSADEFKPRAIPDDLLPT